MLWIFFGRFGFLAFYLFLVISPSISDTSFAIAVFSFEFEHRLARSILLYVLYHWHTSIRCLSKYGI